MEHPGSRLHVIFGWLPSALSVAGGVSQSIPFPKRQAVPIGERGESNSILPPFQPAYRRFECTWQLYNLAQVPGSLSQPWRNWSEPMPRHGKPRIQEAISNFGETRLRLSRK